MALILPWKNALLYFQTWPTNYLLDLEKFHFNLTCNNIVQPYLSVWVQKSENLNLHLWCVDCNCMHLNIYCSLLTGESIELWYPGNLGSKQVSPNPYPHPNFFVLVYINGSLFAYIIYYTISHVEKTLQPFYVHISQWQSDFPHLILTYIIVLACHWQLYRT